MISILFAAPMLVPSVAALESGIGMGSHVTFNTAMLVGVILVLAYLGRKLSDLTRTVRVLEERLKAGPAAEEPVSIPPAARVVEPAREGISLEVAAVIAAAVAATCGRAARVVAVSEGSHVIRAWSLEGRRQIFASHSIR